MPDAFDVLAALIRVDRTPNLAAAARSLAAAGVPLFPCEAGWEATAHPPGVPRREQRPWAGCGVVVAYPGCQHRSPDRGTASGVVVVDVDVHGPVDGRAAWRRASEAGLVDGAGLLVRTPTGGAHAYFPATSGTEQRSWQAASAGVDFRGDGGYIIAPPSRRTIDGTLRRYEITDLAAHSIGPVDAARLRDFLDPRPAPPPRNGDGATATVDAERLAAWVAGRGEGERNRGLFWAACRLAENGTPPTDTLDALGPAAAQAGLSEREIATTVRSAYRATTTEAASTNRTQGSDRWCSRSAPSPVVSAGRAGL